MDIIHFYNIVYLFVFLNLGNSKGNCENITVHVYLKFCIYFKTEYSYHLINLLMIFAEWCLVLHLVFVYSCGGLC